MATALLGEGEGTIAASTATTLCGFKLKPQTGDFLFVKLKGKVFRKSICVALNRKVQGFCGNAVRGTN
jgi:hypothetical protein